MIFNKYLVIGLLVLSGLLTTSGFYIKHLLETNAVLENDIKDKEEKINRLSDTLETQRKTYEKTLETLSERDTKLKEAEKKNSKLKKELNEIIRNEDDECVNADHPESVGKLLQTFPDKVYRSTNPDSTTR